jgi:putative hydrolase
MLQVDLHIHSLFSACGLHTFLELIEQAHKLGIKAIAITDHGPAIGGGRLNSVFFERLQCPYPDLKLYKGVELNLLDKPGEIDVPWKFMPFIDLLLLGVHPNLKPEKPKRFFTDLLLAAMDANPFVDIITHPNDPQYPLDYDRLAEKAARMGIALELNNSKILYKRSMVGDTLELILACKRAGCRMAVNSDTHAIQELGRDDSVRPLLEDADFPAELIVNRDVETAAAFIEERRGLKREAIEARGR